jgi:tRNA-specific adenosine deaminase 2
MSSALHQASLALLKSEVPVGCVLYNLRLNAIVSVGHNLVNATKDPTRHAEMVAWDRLVNRGMASDGAVNGEAWDGDLGVVPGSNPGVEWGLTRTVAEPGHEGAYPDTLSTPQDEGEGGLVNNDPIVCVVTCEPCVMCAGALAMIPNLVGVVYGCSNPRFGGCGSLVKAFGGNGDKDCCQVGERFVEGGVKDEEGVEILKRFYGRENEGCPLEKRRRKEGGEGEGVASAGVS